MSKFPQSLLLPHHVYASRTKRNKEVIKAATLGIYFRLAVIFFELIGVALTSSSVLFLDAMASLVDVISSIFLIGCMKLAQRPPDQDHPFGHGRYEPLGGLILSLFLIVLGGILLIQQMLGLFKAPLTDHFHPLAWIFPAVAMVILEVAYQSLIRIAKREHSPALAADAVHYRIDSLTSLVATFTLIVASFWLEWGHFIDHLGATFIAFFMLGVGLIALTKNFYQLMDRIPDREFFKTVRQAALRVVGVEETEKIRIQQYGPDAHVDIDIEVNPDLSVAKAHQISQEVRLEIQKAWPAVRDVTVHIEPYYANDHELSHF